MTTQSSSLNSYLSEYVAKINDKSCRHCDDCRKVCVREAIRENLSINYNECSGCGNCVLVCPVMAVSLIKRADIK
ncbi:MAG: 4Fe-4S dicluster domain-containing protein [Chloroflexi bacterium]|nr:4Fe-4S dicluster domain-containing protein [Chloroflexota bacterium]